MSVERRYEGIVVRHVEILDNVGLHLRGGRSRECDDRYIIADGIQHRADASILRSEVMPPLRYAMRLINSDKRDIDLLKKLNILVFGQCFWSDEEQFGLTVRNVLFDLFHLGFGERRIEEVSHIIILAVSSDTVDLVLHQCNKRRDDDGRTIKHESRQLVAERLTTACRHDGKSILTAQYTFDDFFLFAFELVESKILMQGCIQGFCSHCHGCQHFEENLATFAPFGCQ